MTASCKAGHDNGNPGLEAKMTTNVDLDTKKRL